MLSIKPEYANAILRGEKRFEFRKVIFARPVDVVVLYVTVPVGRVVGEFDVTSIVRERVTDLWRKTRRYAGIDEDRFHAYFSGREYGYAIKVGAVRKYALPVCPVEEYGIRPPQSFAYLCG